jgi:PAT family beta-lactamase induction signal transducer AmpG
MSQTESPVAPHGTSPWRWIPTLYFGQGLPYVSVMTLSVILYKNLGLSNTDIALYTSWLYLPWVIKPLWSPLVELFGTTRSWVLAMQLLIGAALAGVGLTLPGDDFLRWTLVAFWLMAFSSATHDIAADGFYMQALAEHQQAAFVGVRSTFYRLAMIGGQGGLVYLAGMLKEQSGSYVSAWSSVFLLLGGFFAALAVYHRWALPRPQAQIAVASSVHLQPDGLPISPAPTFAPMSANELLRDFWAVFVAFFRRPGIGVILAFLLLYRFPEAQLLKLAVPFMLDSSAEGGLGLTTQQVGIVYGTVGVSALTLGGILGGLFIARVGLRRALWPLVLCVHLPNLIFVALAIWLPANVWLLSAALAVEQFGYGFGFTAYMMYMIMVAQGQHQTAHYAICTGFMALGMMIPGMWSGWLQDQLGYLNFFLWVCIAAVPSLWAVSQVRIESDFGKADKNTST